MFRGPRIRGQQLLNQKIQLGVDRVPIEHRLAPLDVRRAVIEKPAVERLGGPDVVLVVPGDGLKEVGVASRHVSVVVDDGSGTPLDVTVALIAGQCLQRLQSVGLHAHLEGVGGHRHQVHEQAGVLDG